MPTLSAINLLVSGLTLSLTLGFLIILLWHDAKQTLNQFFALFLLFVAGWNGGALLVQITRLIPEADLLLVSGALSVMELGFTGSSVAVYLLTTVIVGVRIRRIRWLAFSSLLIVVAYRLFFSITSTGGNLEIGSDGLARPILLSFYLIFDVLTAYLLWFYRRRVRSQGLSVGIGLFLLGQTLTFINPALGIASFANTIASIGCLITCFAILQQEIVTPLAERRVQVEAMHKVTLAITSQIRIETVLREIAIQAAGWLSADGVGILLARGNRLVVETVYGLPEQLLHTVIPEGQGIAGTVAKNRESIFVESYGRDWKQTPDFDLAPETFGSVICVPLVYGGEITGVLLVVAGRQGRLFNLQDVYLLELLGAQAAVAIAHSHLFAEQKALTDELETAHSQLETVLSSTENPVLAVDRRFRLIFANPAAKRLLPENKSFEGISLLQVLPASVVPQNFRTVLREARRKGGFVFEVALDGRVYQCHFAVLGKPRIAGWVAILNDVTELKELDRLKSEMVRMASHDLKNPLMGAAAYVELLREDLRTYDNVDVQEALVVVDKQLERMNRIIRGVLDLERLKTSRVLTETCHPEVIIQNCLDELSYVIEDKQVQVEVCLADRLPEFFCDREQFERVIVNLIENAIKFSLADRRVRIAVYTQDHELVFEVQDNGIGIPAEISTKVFDRFFRGQQKGVEHVSGSGLGLSFVKSIVESHGGKVWLSSTEKVGTTFFVAVPYVSYSQ
ncbi:MAG: ATP-binding protein [bacterium]|nr:ATP-binding protein [bacterium]